MGYTIIHKLLTIICAGDLREAAKKTVVIVEPQSLANPSHIVHAPLGTLRTAKESMLRAFG